MSQGNTTSDLPATTSGRWAPFVRYSDAQLTANVHLKPDYKAIQAAALEGKKEKGYYLWCDMHGKNRSHETAACEVTRNEKAMRNDAPRVPFPDALRKPKTRGDNENAKKRKTESNVRDSLEYVRMMKKM